MKPKWHFNQRRASDRIRDSANDAFFTAESLENLSEALIREGIQNSLDAAVRSEEGVRQVRVRIALRPDPSKAARLFVEEAFDPAIQHFLRAIAMPGVTKRNLLEHGYLVFEDFGTRGLTGDVAEYRLENAEKNAFFSFFRAEGRSAKSGDSLGRWGIGKQVFPTASRLHAILAQTIRVESPDRVMMGSAVLRNHSVNGADFQPDAWFGCRGRDELPVLPVEDNEFMDSFAAAFDLKRGKKPGLSIVVPSVDERVNTDDLRRGIVRSFFWPILLGELEVELEGPAGAWSITAETLATHRDLLPSAESAVIEFAGWASTVKPSDVVELKLPIGAKPLWSLVAEHLLPEPVMVEIRSRFEQHQRAAIKIPIQVRPKFEGGEDENSFFTIYVETCRESGHRPIFLRDGIVITDIRSPQMTGIRSLVVVDDKPLAGLLGDAEGVNHTQWQKDSPKFHGRYAYGPDTIKFVVRSVFEVMQRLHAGETAGDPSLLLDIFFLDAEEGPVERLKKPQAGKPEIPPDPPPLVIVSKPKRFELDASKGGFVLKPGNVAFEVLPARLRIEAGYAIRRGDPMRRWAVDDFQFTRAPLRQEPKANGVVVLREGDNEIELEIRKPDFLFGISGFDTRRDLVVKAVELKNHHETDI